MTAHDIQEPEPVPQRAISAEVGVPGDPRSIEALDSRRESGWTWTHNYLGDKSDLAKQLAVNTVLSYYLIVPDGRLLASSTEWESIEEKVLAVLEISQFAVYM